MLTQHIKKLQIARIFFCFKVHRNASYIICNPAIVAIKATKDDIPIAKAPEGDILAADRTVESPPPPSTNSDEVEGASEMMGVATGLVEGGVVIGPTDMALALSSSMLMDILMGSILILLSSSRFDVSSGQQIDSAIFSAEQSISRTIDVLSNTVPQVIPSGWGTTELGMTTS
mmetsp:Transcript_20844/g.37398  ORF Transcript_20844/g.37398 Transcript_20844/m.37398 type:complete len:173 (-) Transcript_20844:41-559(-)